MHTRVPIPSQLRECSVTPLHGERLEYKRSEGWKRRVSAMTQPPFPSLCFRCASIYLVIPLCAFWHERTPNPDPVNKQPLASRRLSASTAVRSAVRLSIIVSLCVYPSSFRCASIHHRFAVRLSIIGSLCIYLSYRFAVRLSILSFRCTSIYLVIPLCVHLSRHSAVHQHPLCVCFRSVVCVCSIRGIPSVVVAFIDDFALSLSVFSRITRMTNLTSTSFVANFPVKTVCLSMLKH